MHRSATLERLSANKLGLSGAKRVILCVRLRGLPPDSLKRFAHGQTKERGRVKLFSNMDAKGSVYNHASVYRPKR